MFGISETTMKKIILRGTCFELLGLEVTTTQSPVLLRRAYVRTLTKFTDSDYEHLFAATQLAYLHLDEHKEIDVYSFLCLCLGVSEEYKVETGRISEIRFNRALRKSYETFAANDDDQMIIFVSRISEVLQILFDHESFD